MRLDGIDAREAAEALRGQELLAAALGRAGARARTSTGPRTSRAASVTDGDARGRRRRARWSATRRARCSRSSARAPSRCSCRWSATRSARSTSRRGASTSRSRSWGRRSAARRRHALPGVVRVVPGPAPRRQRAGARFGAALRQPARPHAAERRPGRRHAVRRRRRDGAARRRHGRGAARLLRRRPGRPAHAAARDRADPGRARSSTTPTSTSSPPSRR